MQPAIKGSFTLVDCQTITEGERAGARIVSFDPSQEFLTYLATTPRNFKFRMAHKRIYINGGIRADTPTAKRTPLLTPEAATAFVTGAKDTIMRSTMRQYGADPKSFRYNSKFYTSYSKPLIYRNNYTLIRQLTRPQIILLYTKYILTLTNTYLSSTLFSYLGKTRPTDSPNRAGRRNKMEGERITREGQRLEINEEENFKLLIRRKDRNCKHLKAQTITIVKNFKHDNICFFILLPPNIYD